MRLAVIDLLVARPALLPRMATDAASLLTAEQEGVAKHAAFLIGKIGKDAAPLLLEALRDKRSRIDQIAEALAQMGRPVVVRLTKATGDPEPRIRRGAALALGQIRPVAPDTVQKLIAGLSDPDPEVKDTFLTAMGSLGPRALEAVPALRTALSR